MSQNEQTINKLFTELLETSRQELRMLGESLPEEDISEKLQAFTRQRQSIIDKIELTRNKQEPVSDDNKEILQHIQTLDEKCQQLLKTRMSQVAGKLKSIQEHKKAHYAYTGGKSFDGGRFYDGKK